MGFHYDFNCKIYADFKCFQLILYNLIQNAVKYNKIEGSIIVIFSLQHISMPLVYRQENDENQEIEG